MKRAFTLIELLCIILILGILLSLSAVAINKAYTYAKHRIKGIVHHHENQLNIYMIDAAPESWLLRYATNGPVEWNTPTILAH